MDEERISSGIEVDSEFKKQVMGQIGSLQDRLVTIQKILERGHSLEKAIDEYRYLPSGLKKSIRWGFIGAWGEGGEHATWSIITGTEESYFDKPQASNETVAAFAAAFTNPDTIKICKYLFREEGHSREDIKEKCNLSDEELDAAITPLLEWHFVEWEDGVLKAIEHGVYYVVTLVGMAQVAQDNKIRCEQC